MVKQKNIRQSAGFTLVEMAIVFIIIGTIVSALAIGLRQFRINTDYAKRDINLQNADIALNQFVLDFARYPCPADPNLDPSNPLYGAEDCTGGGGSHVFNGARSLNGDADTSDPDEQIIVGMFPLYAYDNGNGAVEADPTARIYLQSLVEFREFREKGKAVTDPWSTNFTYAVSSSLTSSLTYDPDNGVIQITDDNGLDTGGINSNGHYVILSLGNNPQDCLPWDDTNGLNLPPGDPDDPGFEAGDESENCDGDAEFRYALRSDGEGADYYDDALTYKNYKSNSYWSPIPTESNSDDLYMTRSGKLSIGGYRKEPEGDFESDALASYTHTSELKVDVSGNVIAETRLAAQVICDDENLEKCIQPESLYNLACVNRGEYLKGVEVDPDNFNLRPICAEIEFNIAGQACSGGQFVNGIYTDGRIVCEKKRKYVAEDD